MTPAHGYLSSTDRTLITPHSSETVVVAVRVAIRELNQTDESKHVKDSRQEVDFWDRPYAYTIAGPFYEMGGTLNFLIGRLLHRKRRHFGTPRWTITDEKHDSSKEKTTFTVRAHQAAMSILVTQTSERNSEVSVNCTQTEAIERFMQVLNDQLKWRE